MSWRHTVMTTLAFALAPVLLAPTAAQAQSNSKQATEAARKHRAEQGNTPRAPAAASREAPAPASTTRPYRSSANPNANPNASLKSCMDHAGMNPVSRDRCMRQHCTGRWGQGDCPAGGGDLLSREGASNTPLGRCLTAAGANPFKRDACGWKHCSQGISWNPSAECTALTPRNKPLAN